MKKVLKYRMLICMLVILCMCAVLGGCAKKKKDGKIHVVCTTFPVYDWVKNIVGDSKDYEVELLMDNGTDLHSFQPSAKDIVKVGEADVFIYIGGESDEWVGDVLKQAGNKDQIAINLMDVLGDKAKVEELKEGMQEEDEHHDHDHDEEEKEYDEHIWLSLKNSKYLCEQIADVLKKKGDSEAIEKNVAAYVEKLEKLDKEFVDMIKNSKNKTVVFGDRFPFRYLVDDYCLDYYAAFAGCSADSEASFETVVFLAKKLEEKKLGFVFVIDKSDKKLANAIIESCSDKNKEVLEIDSMQSTSKKEIEDGASYLGIMEKNLKVLQKGLN